MGLGFQKRNNRTGVINIKIEMQRLCKEGAICLCLSIMLAFMVALLLRTPIFIEQKAYLYRLLQLEGLCMGAIVIIDIMMFSKKSQIWGIAFSESILCIGITSIFVAYFLSMVPTTIDRSYTVYSLSNLADHADQVYSSEEIKTQFIEGYIEEANESQRRIEEQLHIGNLKEVSGGYQISEKGMRMVHLFRFIERIFPVADQNSIYPNGR